MVRQVMQNLLDQHSRHTPVSLRWAARLTIQLRLRGQSIEPELAVDMPYGRCQAIGT